LSTSGRIAERVDADRVEKDVLPTRSPSSFCTWRKRAVSSGQESLHEVKMKLITTTLSLIRSSKKCTC
jgi:hypothetical protein